LKDDESLHFSKGYSIEEEEKLDEFSPYYDGESLLFLVKAAKYIEGYDYLIPVIQEIAPVLAKEYTVDKWRKDHDSDTTKGFYRKLQ
jgi:hypothetical protein